MQGLLDDLEENLNIFDTKLRHMREDIAGGRAGACSRREGALRAEKKSFSAPWKGPASCEASPFLLSFLGGLHGGFPSCFLPWRVGPTAVGAWWRRAVRLD